jgi:hypothetical protein
METCYFRKFKNPIELHIPCRLCGKVYTITVEKEDYETYKSGMGYIQDIFPYLSAADRELLISQTCDECWHKMFDVEF